MEGLLEVEAIMHVPAVSNEVEKLGNIRDLTLPRFLDLFGAMWGDLENVRITYIFCIISANFVESVQQLF